MVALIKHGVSRAAMKQKTFDILDQMDEQTLKYGTKKGETPVEELKPMDAIAMARFDRMILLDGIRQDPGCRIVASMGKCSLEAAAEKILGLVGDGYMTLGVRDGKIRVGITSDGWKAVSRKMNR